MTQIYLDADYVVRVDMTPDGRVAQRANFDREIFEMAGLAKRMATITAEIRSIRGQDARFCYKGIAEMGDLQANVLSRARSRANEAS